MMEITPDQFNKISQQIYRRLGLQFEQQKLYFLQKRVQRRMQTLGYKNAQDYVFHLCYADPGGAEMQALANLITTNETYMFREYEQLEAFANHCLPEVLSDKAARDNQVLRIWSAGCSSGEEPYTLAMIVREVFPQYHGWDCEIVATDIDENILARAQRAIYGERSINEVPAEYLDRHLVREGEQYRVRPATARLVKFRHLNLNDRVGMREMSGFDFVFCRNVLIYFDDLSRKMAVDHFYNALNRGGYIFLGHAESVGRISSAFKLRRVDRHYLYRKE